MKSQYNQVDKKAHPSKPAYLRRTITSDFTSDPRVIENLLASNKAAQEKQNCLENAAGFLP